jgi:NADH-quinone oxidoreductase subunit H
VFIWLRATLPRIRYDRLMRFGWQVLLPLAVLNLLATSAIVTLAPLADQWWISLAFSLVVIGLASLMYAVRRGQANRVRGAVRADGLVMPASVRLVHLDGAGASAASGADGQATVANVRTQ